jgi:preprotein translocase subunit SecE
MTSLLVLASIYYSLVVGMVIFNSLVEYFLDFWIEAVGIYPK